MIRRLLCAIGLHDWRDVTRPGSPLVVRVCCRRCGAREETCIWGRGDG